MSDEPVAVPASVFSKLRAMRPHGCLTYLFLRYRCGLDEWTAISLRDIAAATDLNVGTIRKCLGVLEDLHLIGVDRGENQRCPTRIKVKSTVLPDNTARNRKQQVDSNDVLPGDTVKNAGGLFSISLQDLQEGEGSGEGDVPEKPSRLAGEDVERIMRAWNEARIIVHRGITPTHRTAIRSALKLLAGYEDPIGEILKAIELYGTVVNGREFWFTFRWTLNDFLSRKNGLPNFLEEADPLERYATKNQMRPGAGGAGYKAQQNDPYGDV